jgi:hypothetical protein
LVERTKAVKSGHSGGVINPLIKIIVKLCPNRDHRLVSSMHNNLLSSVRSEEERMCRSGSLPSGVKSGLRCASASRHLLAACLKLTEVFSMLFREGAGLFRSSGKIGNYCKPASAQGVPLCGS